VSGGVKKSFFKFASGLLNSRSFIFKRKRVKPPHKRSKLRLLIDIYKDYKALGKNIQDYLKLNVKRVLIFIIQE